MTLHRAVYAIIYCLFCAANKTSYAGKLLKSLRTSSKTAPLIPSVVKQLSDIGTVELLKESSDSVTISVPDKPVTPSSYILTVCEAGSEKALKTEIGKNHPSLRLAFSRPGFVTFKLPQSDSGLVEDQKAAAAFRLNAVFARQFAASLGSAILIDDVISKAKALLASDPDSSKRLRLHVWGRSEVMPAAGHPLAIGAAKVRVNQIRELLLGCDEAESLWLPSSETDSGLETDDDSRDLAREGEHVFDVIVPTGPFITEPLHIGHHIHFAAPRTNAQLIGHSAWPGGNPKVQLPSEAPSRAYLKIEEGLRWSSVKLRDGDTAVEIGSAPGGASYALLKRGLTVVGIDPCPQDRQHNSLVSMHPKFTHLRMRLSGVKRNQLPAKVEWLLCDANISPHSALPHLADLVCALSTGDQSFCGMFLTVKLGDTAEPIPEILQRVKDIGKGVFTTIGAVHLPSNGQEICVVALTKAGAARRAI